MKISFKLWVKKLLYQKQTARHWTKGVSFPLGNRCSLESPEKDYRWALPNLGLLGEPLTKIQRAGELLQAFSSHQYEMINPHGEGQQWRLGLLMWIMSKDLASLSHMLLGLSLWLASADACILGPLKPWHAMTTSTQVLSFRSPMSPQLVVTIYSIFFSFFSPIFSVCVTAQCVGY